MRVRAACILYGCCGPIRYLRACHLIPQGQRREPILLSSRSEERRIPGVCERRATTKWGELAPALRVAAKIRPYSILALDGGPATACGLGFVSTPRTKTCPWGPRLSGFLLATLHLRN